MADGITSRSMRTIAGFISRDRLAPTSSMPIPCRKSVKSGNHRRHGVAIDPDSGHGFTSNGRDPSVTMFDTKTLKVIQKITVTGRPDGIFFEPITKHIFVESHADPNETVINAADGTVLGTIDLGGEPEQGESDGNGHVFINLESTSEVVVVDPVAMKVTARYKLGDGEGPSGMGLDAKNRRIFSFCGKPKPSFSMPTTARFSRPFPPATESMPEHLIPILWKLSAPTATPR